MQETIRIENGIADYLRRFDRSPYALRAEARVTVKGESTLEGSYKTITSLANDGGARVRTGRQ